jgi:hypothetical protein
MKFIQERYRFMAEFMVRLNYLTAAKYLSKLDLASLKLRTPKLKEVNRISESEKIRLRLI